MMFKAMERTTEVKAEVERMAARIVRRGMVAKGRVNGIAAEVTPRQTRLG